MKFKDKISILATLLLVISIPVTFYYIKNPINLRPRASGTEKKVIGYLTWWDQTRGFQAIQNNSNLFSEVSPFWYMIDTSGNVYPNPEGGANMVDQNIINYLRSNGIKILPSVYNLVNGAWSSQVVSGIINNATTRQTHINKLVEMARLYDGIDIDYENLFATDRSSFSSFINDLAVALHNEGKLLAVTVHPKTSEPGNWNGPQAQDWSALGQSADEVRVMIYDYHWETSGPGSIAPISWVNEVLSFAATVIPRNKIIHGMGTYGYDWIGSQARSYVWEDIIKLPNYASFTTDSTSQTPTFSYTSDGKNHEVWFENAQSIDAKLNITNQVDVGGIHLWRLGGEDSGMFTAIRSKLPRNVATATPPTTSSPTPTSQPIATPTPPISDTTAPSVAITEPANNASVTGKKMKISATAADNIGVTKVEIYIDNALKATIYSPPYEFWYNLQQRGGFAGGPHTIKAIAYDAAGNSALHQVTVFKN